MPLDESFLTLVPHEKVDFVSLALLSKGARVLHQGGLAAGHCSLFASEGEVVVARHVVPLAVLVPYHDDTVLARSEEAVRLVGPPVLELQGAAISPAEVIVKHLIIQTDPLVVAPKTVDELLLLVGGNAGQMSTMHAALPLCSFPVLPLGEVLVAVALKLMPAIGAGFCILLTM